MMTLEEIIKLLSASGTFLIGIASLIKVLKKEQPKPNFRKHKRK